MRQYLKSFSYYGVTIVFNAAVSFVIMSLLTHHLTEREYGIVNLYASFSIFLLSFINVGVDYELAVSYFKMSEPEYRKRFTNGLCVSLFMMAIVYVVTILLYPQIQSLLKVDVFFVLVLPVTCYFLGLNDIFLGLVRNKEHHKLYAGFSIAKNLLESGLTFLLVIVLLQGWSGRLLSSFLTIVVTVLVIFYFLNKWRLLKGDVERKEILKVARLGLPFIPSRWAIFFMAYSDRFFIDKFAGTENVGLYAAGAQIAVIINMLIITLNNTFYPVLLKKMAEEKPDHAGIRKITLIFIGSLAAVVLLVILFTPLIFKLFIGKAFQSGQAYAQNLAIGYFFWGIYTVFLVYLLNAKKNKTIMYISIVGMVLSFGFNWFNVSRFGTIGATYTSIAVYLAMAIMSIVLANKYYNLKRIFFPRRDKVKITAT